MSSILWFKRQGFPGKTNWPRQCEVYTTCNSVSIIERVNMCPLLDNVGAALTERPFGANVICFTMYRL